MALKNIYDDSQKNKIKSKDMTSMPFDDFVEEHFCLIKILREGSREELLAEAKKQLEELKGNISAKEFEALNLEED